MTCSATHDMTQRIWLPVHQSNIPNTMIPSGYQPDPWEKVTNHQSLWWSISIHSSRHSSPVFYKLCSYQLGGTPHTALHHPRRFPWQWGRTDFACCRDRQEEAHCSFQVNSSHANFGSSNTQLIPNFPFVYHTLVSMMSLTTFTFCHCCHRQSTEETVESQLPYR